MGIGFSHRIEATRRHSLPYFVFMARTIVTVVGAVLFVVFIAWLIS